MNEALRIDELRDIRSLDVRCWSLLSALLLAYSGCAEKRTNHEQSPDATLLLASAPATAVASVEPPAPALASAALWASSVPASRLSLTAADEARFDAAVRGAIERQDTPGAVLVVLRRGAVVLRRAYGVRATVTGEVPMTLDAVFDLASLTKPLATATSILLLAERGKLRIQDPVRKWLPTFRTDNRITIEHLLMHTSGLPPGSAAAMQARTPVKVVEKILQTPLEHAPGEAYVYSDLGYVLLGEIVEKASGEPLDVFAKKSIFDPLGMRNATFRPPLELAMRAAPTTPVEEMMMGIAHDPLAGAMGNLAGHAGLFSTAHDITRFVMLLMRKGELDGKAVLSPNIVRQLLDLRPLPASKEQRSLGLVSMFEGIGHTGFTGTAFWIDPARDHAVILLTNAVYPDGKKNAKQVRRDVAAAALLMGTNK